jgi:general secretion pathway protein C
MTDILLYIQKNIFRVSLGSAVFLGFAAAFFLTSVIPLLWKADNSVLISARPAPGQNQQKSGRAYQTKETFYTLMTGNLIRDGGIKSKEAALIENPEEKLGEFTLIGVLAGDRSWARAAVQIDGEQSANEYKIGQPVVGYKILDIFANAIRVKRGSVKLLVKVGEKTSELRSKMALAEPVPSSGTVPSSPDATKITLARDRLLALTRDQSELYKNKFTPFMKGDKIMGLQFIMVPEKNFLYELGLRSGDILRRINGQPMENTQRMIEFYQSLQTADRISVDIERAGKIVPYEVIIQ